MAIHRPLPLEFILSHVSLTRADVKVGLFRGLLAERDVVVLAEHGVLERNSRASDLESELVATLPSDYVATGLNPSEYPRRAAPDIRLAEEKWVYLQLAWLWDHRAESSNPLDEVELMYADFGYPPEIANLVRYMPARPDEPVGEDAMMDSWSAYLIRGEVKFGPRAGEASR